MSPPDRPGIPERFRRPGAVEDIVTATGPHTPVPPRERQRSRPEIEMDPEVMSDAETARSFSGPTHITVPVILLTTLITAAASVLGTYFATRSGVSAPDCATKADVATLSQGQQDTRQSLALLTEKQNRDTDDLKNTMVDLKLKLEVLLQRQK